MILEPILLGLLLAPSLGGLTLSIAALGAFLLRSPLKLYLKDVQAGRQVPRTQTARRFVFIYGGMMTLAGISMLALTPSWLPFLPLVMAAPLVGLQLWHDFHGQSRNPIAELAGAAFTGAIAAAIVLISAWPLPVALSLWAALAFKSVSAVLYVRSRLRLERGKPAARRSAMFVHLVALVSIVGMITQSLLPWTALVAIVVLTGRAAVGLSPLRTARPPKIIGMQEMGYGLGFVIAIILGYGLS